MARALTVDSTAGRRQLRQSPVVEAARDRRRRALPRKLSLRQGQRSQRRLAQQHYFCHIAGYARNQAALSTQLAYGRAGAETVQHHHRHSQCLTQRANRRHHVLIEFRYFHQQQLRTGASPCCGRIVQILKVGDDIERQQLSPADGQASRQSRTHQRQAQRLQRLHRHARLRYQRKLAQLFQLQLRQHANWMTLVDQLLYKPQPTNLILGIQALAMRATAGVGDAVTTLPHPQRFNRQASKSGGDPAAILNSLAVVDLRRK